MNRKNILAADLARKTGISQGQLSRFVRGAQVWIGAPDILKLSQALKCTTAETADLVAAHLLDEAQIPGRPEIARCIKINVEGRPARLEQQAIEVPVAHKATFDSLARAVVRSKQLRDILYNLAEVADKLDEKGQ